MKVVEEKVPESSLDSVLDKLKGPKLISTITKSSIDWDNFKGEEGLEDDLAAAAKDGLVLIEELIAQLYCHRFSVYVGI